MIPCLRLSHFSVPACWALPPPLLSGPRGSGQKAQVGGCCPPLECWPFPSLAGGGSLRQLADWEKGGGMPELGSVGQKDLGGTPRRGGCACMALGGLSWRGAAPTPSSHGGEFPCLCTAGMTTHSPTWGHGERCLLAVPSSSGALCKALTRSLLHFAYGSQPPLTLKGH